MSKCISDYPIGVRVLSPEMMKCTFKHTDAVLRKIHEIRDLAKNNQADFNRYLRVDPDNALSIARGYNNAISVLGSRGSGKTSIIMTLQHILRCGENAWEKGEEPQTFHTENIIMPMLVPQDFANGQSLLSWVIAQLIEKANKIERDISSNNRIPIGYHGPFNAWMPEDEDDPFVDPLRDSMDSLKQSFSLRYKNGLTDETVGLYIDEVRKDAELVNEMLKIISMIIDYYRYINKKEEPLIFFVIDDLDLAPERSQEVLGLILRYLKHPNVVVLCGWNQELYQTHLCMEVLKKQSAIDAGLIEVNGDYTDVFMTRQRKRIALLDSARRLAMDNLKKAFPPALRYEVRGLNTEQRAFFPYDNYVSFSEEDNCSLFSLIEKTLQTSRQTSDPVDFLHNRSGEKLIVYMRILDNKSRGLLNVYHSFDFLRNRFLQWDTTEELDITYELQTLLDTILFSNTHFVPYRRGIRDLIRIDNIIIHPEEKKSTCEFYCNFQHIIPTLNDYFRKKANAEEDYYTNAEYNLESEYNYFPSIILDTFILLNFMENVFRYVCKLPKYEHGGIAFGEALNNIIPSIHISDENNDLLAYAILSESIDEIQLFPTTYDFSIHLNLLDAYEKNHFWDGQYDFTGSHSYCRLSNAISGLLSNGNLLSIEVHDEVVEIPDINIDELSALRSACPEWTNKIERLFGALFFCPDNTKRLAKFRCYKLQRPYADTLTIADASRESSSNVIETIRKIAESRPIDSIIADTDMDSLVNMLRELETFEKRNNKTKSKKGDEPLGAANTHGKRMHAFINEFENDTEEQWFDVDEYQKRFNPIVTDEYALSESISQYDEEKAKEVIKGSRKNLLWNFKVRLYSSFIKEYERYKSVEDQYAFLLKASEAIGSYTKRWNLGHGTWTTEDKEIAEELQRIINLAKEPKDDAERMAANILEYGPVLASTGRENFQQSLNKLKNWYNRNTQAIPAKNRVPFQNDINSMQEAVGRISRKMAIEGDFEKCFNELGEAIAEQCATISNEEPLIIDKTSSERNRTSWPIIEKNRVVFNNWHIVKTTGSASKDKTLFNE